MKKHPKQRKYPAGYEVRDIAVQCLFEIFDKNQSLDLLNIKLNAADLSPEDRGFAYNITLTTLRYYGALRAAIDAHLAQALPQQSQRVYYVLTSALAQLWILKTPPHAVIDLAVELTKNFPSHFKYAGLVNAVLRKLSCQEPRYDYAKNLPAWLWVRWVKTYGAEKAEAIVKAQLSEPPLDLSFVNDPSNWDGATLLPTGSLRLNHHSGAITQLPDFERGIWWVQEAAARLPVLVMGDVKGKRVLDCCAAPGGKTMALVAAGANVTALDRSSSRMKLLKENLARTAMDAEVIVADATVWQPENLYDIVLLDAPCSSTGTLRRHPDVAWLKNEEDVHALAVLQEKLLRTAPRWLKPGGTLVYSTCSLEPEEGEAQVERFLSHHADFSSCQLEPKAYGLPEAASTQNGALRTTPDLWPEWGGIDGFFVAKLQKN